MKRNRTRPNAFLEWRLTHDRRARTAFEDEMRVRSARQDSRLELLERRVRGAYFAVLVFTVLPLLGVAITLLFQAWRHRT